MDKMYCEKNMHEYKNFLHQDKVMLSHSHEDIWCLLDLGHLKIIAQKKKQLILKQKINTQISFCYATN